MNSPDINIAFLCSVCEQEKIENAFNVQRRRRELDNMYRPPVTRSNNWLGMFIAVVLVIGAAVALGRVWG